MEVLVFLPGILGSKLATPAGEELWPPTPFEALRGYRRLDQLLRNDLVVTGIVERVCIDVYGSILQALEEMEYTENGAQHRLVRHAYDWRRDLIKLSDELGDALTDLVTKHGTDIEIKIVCHSMGGLVTRALLERPDAATQPWYKAVKARDLPRHAARGARRLAFARAIGVGGSSLGLNPAQLRKLADAAGYPAGYQLFPPAALLAAVESRRSQAAQRRERLRSRRCGQLQTQYPACAGYQGPACPGSMSPGGRTDAATSPSSAPRTRR